MPKSKESTAKVNVTFRLGKDRAAALDELGKYYDRDRSYLVNVAVEEYLARHDWQVEQVKLARREVADGKFLTEEQFLDDLKTWL